MIFASVLSFSIGFVIGVVFTVLYACLSLASYD